MKKQNCVGEACKAVKEKVTDIFRKSGSRSYNPFKMWGSYVGALLLALPTFLELGYQAIGALLSCPSKDAGLFMILSCSGSMGYFQTTLAVIVSLIPGFLIGWGVHALVRRIRHG